MKKLTLAAALAAGMTTIAFAQEAPANAESMQAHKAAAIQALKARSANAEKTAEKGEVASTAAAKAQGLPGVDPMKTGSIAAEKQAAKKAEKPAAKKAEKTVAKKADKPAAKKVASKTEKPAAQKASAKAAEKRPELVVTHRNNGSASMISAAGVKAVEKAAGGKEAKAPSGQFGALIAKYASTYGVPLDLAHAVIRVESNYRPQARGAAGEVGLMQIKPATARGMGYSGTVKALYHPENNIKYGMKYLGIAHKLGDGSTCGTILKYNAGHGAKRMNKISAAYCTKVKRHLGA